MIARSANHFTRLYNGVNLLIYTHPPTIVAANQMFFDLINFTKTYK